MPEHEVHGQLCDVCGQEITAEQTLVQIPGIGYMHDDTQVPDCVSLGTLKLRLRAAMRANNTGDDITDAINADPAEVQRLRQARKDARDQSRNRGLPDTWDGS